MSGQSQIQSQPNSPQDIRKKRVLIVEDEVILSMNSQLWIESLGHEVVAIAESGERALEIVKETEVDLILMDVKLDGKLDGIETMDMIEEFSDCKVLYITGNSNVIPRIEAQNPSAHYLIKPVTIEMVKAALSKLLVNSLY